MRGLVEDVGTEVRNNMGGLGMRIPIFSYPAV